MEEITKNIYSLIYGACKDSPKSQDITSKIVSLSEKSSDNIVAILENEGFNNIASKILAQDVLTIFK